MQGAAPFPPTFCPADELKLLQVFRQAVQDLHGEALLGIVLASLQGEAKLIAQSSQRTSSDRPTATGPGQHFRPPLLNALDAVKYYDPVQQMCIVRCGRDEHEKV